MQQPTKLLIDDIDIDCTERESHELSAKVTSHRIASGSNTTDHVRMDPDVLNIDCWISNTPLDLPSVLTDGASLENVEAVYELPSRQVTPLQIEVRRVITFNLLGLSIEAEATPANTSTATVENRLITKQFSSTMNRRQAVYEELRAKMELGLTVTVITSLREYTDMIIQKMSVPVDSSNGDALYFRMSLKQVRFASAQVGAIDPAIFAAERKKKKGEKAKKTATASDEKKAKDSIISKGADFISGLISLPSR